MSFTIKELSNENLDDYVDHSLIEIAQSGVDGDSISTPYSKDEPFEPEAFRNQTRNRWNIDIKQLGWRRCWGIFDRDAIAAHIELCGPQLRSESHRVRMGMFVTRKFRRQGMGRALLLHAIQWTRDQNHITWLDLGVFGGNRAAYALYQEMNFTELGRTPDRFRVDETSIDNIKMTLNVTSRP
jgi:GNAT superfamily N-acetyltransferase